MATILPENALPENGGDLHVKPEGDSRCIVGGHLDRARLVRPMALHRPGSLQLSSLCQTGVLLPGHRRFPHFRVTETRGAGREGT